MPAVTPQAKKKLKASQKRYANTPRGKWAAQKAQAKSRGHQFFLSFEEWLQIWTDSGCYGLRGKKLGQFCMARKGDKGPYIVGNVDIVEISVNLSQQVHKKKSEK